MLPGRTGRWVKERNPSQAFSRSVLFLGTIRKARSRAEPWERLRVSDENHGHTPLTSGAMVNYKIRQLVHGAGRPGKTVPLDVFALA